MLREEVCDGIGWNSGLVHLHEGDLFSVRRPEVIAANVQFFGVDPIYFAIEEVVVLVVGESGFVSLGGDSANIKVVMAKVSETIAVRRELGVAGIAGRTHGRGGAILKGKEPELAVGIEQDVFGIRGPVIWGDGVTGTTFALTLIFDFGDGRGQRCHLF